MSAQQSVNFTIGPVGVMRGMIAQGVGPTEGLRQFRAAGGSIRTQRWFAAYGELAAEAAVRPSVLAQPPRVPFSADQITKVTSAKPGSFLYRGGVIVSVRAVDPLTGKETETTQINFASIRHSQILDPDTVQQELESRFGPEGQSGLERSSVIGSFISAVNELVPLDVTDEAA